MSDPFALLGLPRRPWLDDAAIRAAFQARARICHPDAQDGCGEVFAELNAAHAMLADRGERLRLLAGDAPIPAMPPDVQLGFRIADAIQGADRLAEKANAGTNVLSRVLLASEAGGIRRRLDEIVDVLDASEADLENRLRELDSRWPDAPQWEIAVLAGEYVFLKRWRGQVRERLLMLEILFGKSAGARG